MGRQVMSICAVRISRTLADGTPDYGNVKGSWVACGVGSLAYTFEIDTGDDIFEKDGCNRACLVRKYPDQIKRVNLELQFCTHDYKISEILGTAVAVTDPVIVANVVGYATIAGAGCGAAATGNPRVILEAWSEQWACNVAHDPPYVRNVFPNTVWTPAGVTLERAGAVYRFTGIGSGNAHFGDGPFHDLPELNVPTYAGFVQAEVDDDAIPACASDYVAMGAPLVHSTGATAGVPGTWTPASSTPPSSVANLIAAVPNAVTASPTSAWTTGQYVQTGTAGTTGRAHWTGTAWATGVA